MVPADKVEAEKGRPRLTLVPLSLHTTEARKDDLHHVTFVHHGDEVVACIEHRPDGSMALMVAEGARGKLQYGFDKKRGKIMLEPGEIVEIPSSKGVFRHEINIVPPESGSRGLQFGFTEVSSDGKKLRPRSYNYPTLPYAWHPKG